MTRKQYTVEDEIAEFFTQTTVTRSACDVRAKELVGGDVTPVAVQGLCSYTVYAGANQEFVVQFRLRPLLLKIETITLARQIYGSLIPWTTTHGHMGDMIDGKECLVVYVMDRVKGISQLDFELAQTASQNSPEFFVWRQNLISDMAKFFARAWKLPVEVDDGTRETLRQRYETDLNILLDAMPDRFHPIIRRCLDSLPAIMSLPMVLLHKDFGVCNVMVDEKSNHLVGIIDWAEAEIGPFGLNLYSLQQTMGHLHLKDGWTRYDDYEALDKTFWDTLMEEAGFSEKETPVIKLAMSVGLLLSHGFTSRLASMPPPEPIRDDAKGAYRYLSLDAYLINSTTKFIE